MNLNLRIFIILLMLIGIYSIVKVIKRKNLSMKYGLYWTIIFIFMLILVIFPNIVESIAALCGFKEAPNMLFLIAIFILFYIIFRLYITISKLQEMNRSLIQEVALLKKDNKK